MSRPVALVTGASRGIGRAIAVALGDTHHVLVGGRDRHAVAEVVASLPDAAPFLADLTDEAAVTTAVAGIRRLDVLVHSAGVLAHYGPFAEATTDRWRTVLDVNLIAPATLTRLLLPALRQAHGLVVFINSGAGLTAGRGMAVYAASKFALTGLADALRADEAGRIKVTTIHPGRTATAMQEELRAAEGGSYVPTDYLEAEDVARTVRLAVDLPPGASLNSLRIAPA
jgi:NAD(P)-dependent dehydrogenase (short-subunit alcohol dehydrogenase family)